MLDKVYRVHFQVTQDFFIDVNAKDIKRATENAQDFVGEYINIPPLSSCDVQTVKVEEL